MSNQVKFHIGLHVSNMASTVSFYEKLFQSSPVKVKSDYAKFELENPGLVISFMESRQNVNPEFGHLGLRVETSEMLQERKEVVERHLTIQLEEENTNCCYARQDKFWVNDPDGYEWEVYHFKEDVESNEKQFQAAPCC